MAEQFIALGLQTVPFAVNNHQYVTRPVSRRYQKLCGRYEPEVDDDEGWMPDERGLVLKRRSEVGSDEEIVETAIPRNSRNDNSRALVHRASSVDRNDYGYDRSRHAGALVPYRDRRDASDSEGSPPPRSSRAGRSRAKSTSGPSRHGRSSSSSSSSLGSSTDDEKKVKRALQKKWLTAGLAAVATAHAATKVYHSLERHDKRLEKFHKGQISPEENRKKRNIARCQDAVAVGIAALGIKGAMSEWHEVEGQQQAHKQMEERKCEMHKKRRERERRHARDQAWKNSQHGGSRSRSDYDDRYDRRR